MEQILRTTTAPQPAPAKLLGTAEERFVAVSVALTGFDHVALVGTGVMPEYLATVEKWVGPEITAELLRFGTDPPPDDYIVRTKILADPTLGDLARNVILLWYNGTWTPLSVDWYRANQSKIPNLPDLANLGTTYVVSAQSYVESLVWIAGNTHPMGAKQPGYGTWAEPPKKGV